MIDKTQQEMEDGPLFMPEAGEYAIIIDGDFTGLWAENPERAMAIYLAELATRREHATRNPANSADIPFMGEPVPVEDDFGNGLQMGLDF